MRLAATPRILAIAPGAQHLGAAVLEGEELIWFGVKAFPGRKTIKLLLGRAKKYLEDLLRRHGPQILVVDEPCYAQARLSPLVRALTHAIKRWGRQKRLRVISQRPTTVKERLCIGKKTRKSLGEAMVLRYPFLYAYTKPPRTRTYWQQMLDAIALGVLVAMGGLKK